MGQEPFIEFYTFENSIKIHKTFTKVAQPLTNGLDQDYFPSGCVMDCAVF